MADEKPADPLRTAIRMANQARGAKQSKLLQPEEIERLLRQADLLQQNAVWLNLELDALPGDEPMEGDELEAKIAALKRGLNVVLEAAYRIGADTVVASGNRRLIAAERAAFARKQREVLSQRRDRIRDQTLGGLKLADLSMGEVKEALNAKLRAAGCEEVSERTAARWKSAFLKARKPAAKKI